MKKSFESLYGPKQIVRNTLCDIAETTLGTPKSVFTLPGRKGLCVKTFRKRFGQRVSITGIERNIEDWNVITNKGINCELCDVQTYVNGKVNRAPHFDLVFLDYFGSLDQSKLQDIKTFLSNRNIIHKGKPIVLGVTLIKGARYGRDKIRNELIAHHTYDGKRIAPNTVETVGEVLANFISCEFPAMETVRMLEVMEYKATKASSAMYFYCLELKF